MAIVSITQAADMVRLTRQTLYTHKKKGKLSFTRMEDDSVGVDTSELERVYGKLYLNVDEIASMSSDSVNVKSDTTRHSLTPKSDSIDKGLQAEITRISDLLDKEKSERDRERRAAEDQISDLRTQRDKWEKQASSAMLRLEYHEDKEKASIDIGEPEKPKRRFFGLLPA